MINSVVLIGNLGRDPEVRYTPAGAAVTNFSLAVNEVYTSDGEQKTRVSWFRVVCFGKLAETVSEYMKKGRQVAVQGNLRENRWTDNNGKPRSRVEIMARSVQFLGGRPTETEAPAETPSSKTDEDIPF